LSGFFTDKELEKWALGRVGVEMESGENAYLLKIFKLVNDYAKVITSKIPGKVNLVKNFCPNKYSPVPKSCFFTEHFWSYFSKKSYLKSVIIHFYQ